VTALGNASRHTTRIALDLVQDASEITRQRLIVLRGEQDPVCIIVGKIRMNRPDVRKAKIRIMGSGRGGQEQKEWEREVVRSASPDMR